MITDKMYRNMKLDYGYVDQGIMDCNQVYNKTIGIDDIENKKIRDCFLVAMWLLINKPFS